MFTPSSSFFFTDSCIFDSIVIASLIDFQEAELEELEKSVEPTWPKLVEPLEKIVDRLTVVWGMINHLKAVKDTPELRAAIEDVQVE